MANLMKYKIFYFLISLLVILPGLYFLLIGGLKLGIDFTGGALLEYRFDRPVEVVELKDQFSQMHIEVGSVVASGENTYTIRTKPIKEGQLAQIKNKLFREFGNLEERRVEFVGPVIGRELSQKAIIALVLASVAIILYIAFSFRKVPKPTSSWRFGISAVVALLHDTVIVVGIFAILGKVMGVEIDTLFVTALLTIIGFSVHDTIVVFDRIRENLTKHRELSFTEVTNLSVVQTLGRSLSTSLTVVFVLTALLLFGGDSLKWFTVALMIGIISGTYSSIFNASALLAFWEEKLGH